MTFSEKMPVAVKRQTMETICTAFRCVY